ncbi:hypothetical protein KC332_g15117 [Hortaea werneckii]|nr:hypothetical protein KC358_g14475 [Hortaea werneckii]KAI6811319.1 hypothetical protein KC350_g12263 [Hortaea werneckii]KAI6917415.1 hypothetical protein KC348_g11198 [Hortaea werneckii]KAI6919406.1 hypothetical protein KC341_g17320 [Hortaea werneckii]KAI6952910.1 hypothetical protein KC321_g17296 [Hortaea werneckii]
MHFSTSTLLTATYLAFSAQARPAPVPTYSVVDVDGGEPSASPTTIYQTVTTQPEQPETTEAPAEENTVSVTIVESPSPTSDAGVSSAEPETTESSIPTDESSSIAIPSNAVSSQTSSTPISTDESSTTATSILSSSVPTQTLAAPASSNETSSFSTTVSNTSPTETPAPAAPETTFPSSSSCLDSTSTTTARETSISTAPPSIITTTLISISTATPTFPSSTTQYYDNGLWHTWYPMKEPFYPPAAHAPHTASHKAMQAPEGVAAPTGTGYAKKAVVPSGVAAASGAMIPRAAQPSGFLVAAATGAAGLAGRAAPTGGARYNVVSWNETAAAS